MLDEKTVFKDVWSDDPKTQIGMFVNNIRLYTGRLCGCRNFIINGYVWEIIRCH